MKTISIFFQHRCGAGSGNRGKHDHVYAIQSINTIASQVHQEPWHRLVLAEYSHDDVIKWKHFMMTSSNGNIFRVTGPLCGEFTGHRWIPHHKGQWRGVLMFSLIYALINVWVNNHEADDLRRHIAHYDVIVMRFLHQKYSSVYCYHSPKFKYSYYKAYCSEVHLIIYLFANIFITAPKTTWINRNTSGDERS